MAATPPHAHTHTDTHSVTFLVAGSHKHMHIYIHTHRVWPPWQLAHHTHTVVSLASGGLGGCRYSRRLATDLPLVPLLAVGEVFLVGAHDLLHSTYVGAGNKSKSVREMVSKSAYTEVTVRSAPPCGPPMVSRAVWREETWPFWWFGENFGMVYIHLFFP